MEPSKKEIRVSVDDVTKFVDQLDRLYKEKPAGYLAYITTCHSAMAIGNVAPESDQTKNK